MVASGRRRVGRKLDERRNANGERPTLYRGRCSLNVDRFSSTPSLLADVVTAVATAAERLLTTDQLQRKSTTMSVTPRVKV
jgi:hypothetical protein